MFGLLFWPVAAVMVYLGTSTLCAAGPMCGMRPQIMKCLNELGVSEEKFKEAKKSGNFDDFDPCFFKCFFKQGEIINSEGKYDVDKALEFNRSMMKNEDILAKFDTMKKECAKVNDEEVSDGDKGCERSFLLFKCFSEHKHHMLLEKEDE